MHVYFKILVFSLLDSCAFFQSMFYLYKMYYFYRSFNILILLSVNRNPTSFTVLYIYIYTFTVLILECFHCTRWWIFSLTVNSLYTKSMKCLICAILYCLILQSKIHDFSISYYWLFTLVSIWLVKFLTDFYTLFIHFSYVDCYMYTPVPC